LTPSPGFGLSALMAGATMIDQRAANGHAGGAMRTLTTSDTQPLFACLPTHQVLDHVAGVLEPESLLSGPEMARAEALARPDRRRDFVAARLLTRLLLRRRNSDGLDLASIADIVLEQSCASCGGPHGRPADVFGLSVSWAHAGGFVAAAVGPGHVGVDVEPLVRARLDRPDEARALRGWVRGEAIVKWGHGTVDDAVSWRPLLEGRLAPRGQRYLVDDDGRPRRRRRPVTRVPGLVITDAPAENDRAVCSVAAHQAARWVNPLL
jgi:4'-phosphopantetheinyl transferase